MFYSKTTGGFYDKDIHETIPSDAVEISREIYNDLMENQAYGKVISSDLDGYPILIDSIDDSTYYEKRMIEYPPITDFIDAYYWSLKGNNELMNSYIDKCDQVKLKYPKS